MTAATRNAPAAARPVVDILVASPRWAAQPAVRSLIRRAIAAAAAWPRPGVVARRSSPVTLSVLLTDDVGIQKLNRKWRHKDAPTNVLSFPAAGCQMGFLGDIAIAYETVEREAGAEDKRFADHLSHLVVHGFLHLLGYDHETDAEADAMEALEIAILKRLGVPNPHVACGAKG